MPISNNYKRKIKILLSHATGQFISGNKPSFIIAGAQKSGTSPLFFYLNTHPDLQGSSIKEVRFFDRDDNYEKGEKWYHNYFIKKPWKTSKGKLFFEASPSYLYYPETASRIYKYNSNVKLIFILREPVSRAYSAWNMFNMFFLKNKIPTVIIEDHKKIGQNSLYHKFYEGKTFPTFEACIESEIKIMREDPHLMEPSLLRKGIYYPQIKNFLEIFPKEQLMILGSRDLHDNRDLTLNKILKFLRKDPISWKLLGEKTRNKKGYTSKISIDTKKSLNEFYKPHNEQLEDLLGYQLNW